MKEGLLKIINHYDVENQLRKLQEEVYELNEVIIIQENTTCFKKNFGYLDDVDHITEEIADVMVLLKQFQYYYDISTEDIEKVMEEKIERQLGRIENECSSSNRKIN